MRARTGRVGADAAARKPSCVEDVSTLGCVPGPRGDVCFSSRPTRMLSSATAEGAGVRWGLWLCAGIASAPKPSGRTSRTTGAWRALSARGIANALKKALVAAIGWNLMLLVAHQTGLPVRGRTQTGLTPRGRSARSDALVYDGACIGHLLALGALVVSSYRRFRHLLRPLPTFRPLPRINPRVALSR